MKHTKQYQLLSAATASSAHYKAAQLEATKESASEVLSNAFRDLLYLMSARKPTPLGVG
jgi:hypothetical protein